MPPPNRPSTTAWIVAHLVYPLLPAFLEGVLRFAIHGRTLRLDTLNAATLAMSVALIAVFVNQSIRTNESRVSDEYEEASRNGMCTFFNILAVVFFVLFSSLIVLGALVSELKVEEVKSIFEFLQILVLVSGAVPLIFAIHAQRTYKLRASLV